MTLGLSREAFDSLDALGVLGSGGSKELAFVRFRDLYCGETEDTTGGDEAHLWIYPDEILNTVEGIARGALLSLIWGGVPGALEEVIGDPTAAAQLALHKFGDINDGHTWDLGWVLPMLPGRWFTAKLEDIDYPDNNDVLYEGRFRLSASNPNVIENHNGTLYPNELHLWGDDAQYYLRYDVVRIPVVQESEGTPDVVSSVLNAFGLQV